MIGTGARMHDDPAEPHASAYLMRHDCFSARLYKSKCQQTRVSPFTVVFSIIPDLIPRSRRGNHSHFPLLTMDVELYVYDLSKVGFRRMPSPMSLAD